MKEETKKDPVEKIKQLLDNLKTMEENSAKMRALQETKIEEAIPPEVAENIEKIKAVTDPGIERLSVSISMTQATIVDLTLEHGEKVAGRFYQAIISKGRITWNNDIMTGFLLAHPELEAAKKTGKPTVSIRKVKGEQDV